MRRYIAIKRLLGELLPDPYADAGTNYRDGKGRKAAGSGFTLMMEGVILSLVRHMAVSTAAREIGEHDTKIWRVLEYHVEEALKLQDFSDVNGIGVDEYSHKGHNYITVFVSHPEVVIDEEGRRRSVSKPRVLFVTQGKDKAAVERFLARFKEKKGDPEAVNVATSDMIHGFRNAMNECFPDAITTVDKFHVVSNCEDAVDRVRRREAASGEKRKSKALAVGLLAGVAALELAVVHQAALAQVGQQHPARLEPGFFHDFFGGSSRRSGYRLEILRSNVWRAIHGHSSDKPRGI